MGRTIEPGEGEHTGGEAVLVLGYQFWQRRFGGDTSVVGTTVRLDGQPTRIIGVAPPGFHGLYQGAEIEGYVPLGSQRRISVQSGALFTDRTLRFLTMVARLRPAVSIEAAQAAVDTIAQRLSRVYPQEKNVGARVLPEAMARPIPMRFLSELIPLIRDPCWGWRGWCC